jgi:hypothetical protein
MNLTAADLREVNLRRLSLTGGLLYLVDLARSDLREAKGDRATRF